MCQEVEDAKRDRAMEAMRRCMGVRVDFRGFLEAVGMNGRRQLWGKLKGVLKGEEERELERLRSLGIWRRRQVDDEEKRREASGAQWLRGNGGRGAGQVEERAGR